LQRNHNSLCCKRHEHGCTVEPHARHYGHSEVARTCGHGTTCAWCHPNSVMATVHNCAGTAPWHNAHAGDRKWPWQHARRAYLDCTLDRFCLSKHLPEACLWCGCLEP
jgi:hypothetical protein